MANLWDKVDAHLNNVAFYQTIFSLPFAYTAVLLASDGDVNWWIALWVTVAIISARTAALALDNLLDLKFDKDQPKFQHRPMVAGTVKHWEVYALIACCMGLLVFAVLQVHPICIKLLPIAALPFIVYPLMKRVTCFCHYVCGIAVAMAPAGAWVAVTGEISYPMVVLYIAVTLWIGGFDVIYGAPDEEFDKRHGLHSMSVALGVKNALVLARLTHVVTLVIFCYFGQLMSLGYLYYVGVAIAAATLYYQHHIVAGLDFSVINRHYYMLNGVVSVAIFVFTLLSVLL